MKKMDKKEIINILEEIASTLMSMGTTTADMIGAGPITLAGKRQPSFVGREKKIRIKKARNT